MILSKKLMLFVIYYSLSHISDPSQAEYLVYISNFDIDEFTLREEFQEY